MRPYLDTDHGFLELALLSEGLKPEQMTFETDKTFVTDAGFFSYRIESWCPRLVHFYVDKAKRSIANARKLFNCFRDIMIREGHTHFIVGIPEERPHMRLFIKYLGQNTPFTNKSGDDFYLVPTIGRSKH